jgi:glycosyltransferase involved in cell wall biosynthesis
MSAEADRPPLAVLVLGSPRRRDLVILEALAETARCRVTVASPADRCPNSDAVDLLDTSEILAGRDGGGPRGAPAAILRSARRQPGRLWRTLREALETETLRHLRNGALLADALAEAGADVIVTVGATETAQAAGRAASLLGLPLILRLEASDVEAPASLGELALLAAAADRVAVPSRWTASRLTELGLAEPSRIAVVRPGVRRSRLPRRSRRSDDRPQAVCLADGLAPRKGVQVLLDAAHLLGPGASGPAICVIGGDDSGERLFRYRRAVESGSLAGSVEMAGALGHGEAMERLSGADLLLLPSVRTPGGEVDDVPAPLPEAFAMGVPVVASGLPGIAELVSHGETGLLAEAGDPADLARCIRWALRHRDEVERMAAAAADLAERELDAACEADALSGLVLEVSGRP